MEFPCLLPSRMDCHHWCRYRFLPSRHHPSSYDDDFWSPDYRQGGFQVSLQGCWCQHSPWCGRCRCLVHLRSNAGPDVRKGFSVEDDNCSIDCVGGVVEAGNGAEVI